MLLQVFIFTFILIFTQSLLAQSSYYELLGVAENATDEEIKRSYRKLALLHHPDKNMHNVQAATIKMREINEAYGVLKDPGKRALYDARKQDVIRKASKPKASPAPDVTPEMIFKVNRERILRAESIAELEFVLNGIKDPPVDEKILEKIGKLIGENPEYYTRVRYTQAFRHLNMYSDLLNKTFFKQSKNIEDLITSYENLLRYNKGIAERMDHRQIYDFNERVSQLLPGNTESKKQMKRLSRVEILNESNKEALRLRYGINPPSPMARCMHNAFSFLKK